MNEGQDRRWLSKQDTAARGNMSVSKLDRWRQKGWFPQPAKQPGTRDSCYWEIAVVENFWRLVNSGWSPREATDKLQPPGDGDS